MGVSNLLQVPNLREVFLPTGRLGLCSRRELRLRTEGELPGSTFIDLLRIDGLVNSALTPS